MSDVLMNVVKALDLSEWLKIVERCAHNTSRVGQMVAVDRLHNCIDLVRILRVQAEDPVHLVFSGYWELLTIDGSPISSQGPVRTCNSMLISSMADFATMVDSLSGMTCPAVRINWSFVSSSWTIAPMVPSWVRLSYVLNKPEPL
jgi:hypothetical protein